MLKNLIYTATGLARTVSLEILTGPAGWAYGHLVESLLNVEDAERAAS